MTEHKGASAANELKALAREARRWEPLATLRGHTSAVAAVCILECRVDDCPSEDMCSVCGRSKGVSYVSGDNSGAVNVWRHGRIHQTWRTQGGAIAAIAAVDCSRVLVQTRACRVYLLRVGNAIEAVWDFAPSADEHSFCRMAVQRISSETSAVAVPCGTGDVAVFHVANTGAVLMRRIPEPEGAGIVTCLRWLESSAPSEAPSNVLFAGHDDGCVYVHGASGALLRRIKLFPMTVTALDVTSENDCCSLVAVGPQRGVVLIRGVSFGDGGAPPSDGHFGDECVIRSEESRNEGFSDVSFLRGNRFGIVTAGWDGKIRLFNSDLAMLLVVPAAADTLESLCVHGVRMHLGIPDPRRPTMRHGRLVAAASKDRTVRVFCFGRCCVPDAL